MGGSRGQRAGHRLTGETGETGEKTIEIPEPAFLPTGPAGHPKDGIMATGAGQVEYTLTTNGGAHADSIVVQTPECED